MDIIYNPATKDVIIGPKFEQHIGRIILQSLQKQKDKLHQIDVATGNTETHGSVRTRSIRVAQALKARGVKTGDVMLICAVNHNDASIPFISSMYLGTMPVCLAVGMTYEEIKHITSFMHPCIIFSDLNMIEPITKVLLERNIRPEIVVFGTSGNKDYTPFSDLLKPTGTEEDFKCEEFDPETTAAFAVCSSGTTGLPKLVTISHKTMLIQMFLPLIIADKSTVKEVEDLQTGFLCFSAMYWISGLYSILGSCIYGHIRLHSSQVVTMELIKSALQTYKPQSGMFCPFTLYELVKYAKVNKIDFSCLKAVYLGGSLLSEDILRDFQNLLPNGRILINYGGTESGSIASGVNFKGGAVGKLMKWLDWKIVDINTEERLGPNKIGELRLKTITLFQGYYNDPESTKNAYDIEGYYKTGDLLYYDEEENFFFVDRCKEVIKYDNFQISTAELESKICSLQEVLMAAVVGIPDEANGELPMAFVQLTPGSKISAQKIKDLIKDSYSDYKQLRGGVVFLDQLPLTHTGKLNRKVLNTMKLTMKGE